MLRSASPSSSPRPRWKLAIFILFLVIAAAASLISAAAYTDCTGGTASISGNIGSSTVAFMTPCTLTIRAGATATDITFAEHTDLTLIVEASLDCGSAATKTGCLVFGALTGGSITIRGLTRSYGGTIPGGTSPSYDVVRFDGVVSGTDINIQNVRVTFNDATATEDLQFQFVHFVFSVSGKGAAGSVFNVSRMAVSGSVATTAAQLSMYAIEVYRPLSDYEVVEVSFCELSGLRVSASTTTVLIVLNTRLLTGLNTATSSIVLRGNRAVGVSVAAPSGSAILVLFQGGGAISGVATLVVDGFDARQCKITGQLVARFLGLGVFAAVTMVESGRITVSRVWLGGQTSYTLQSNPASHGAEVARFQDFSTGVQRVAVTDCVIEFPSAFGPADVGSSVNAIAFVLRFTSGVNVPSAAIVVSNCSIRGSFTSYYAVQLRIFTPAGAVTAARIEITNCGVYPESAAMIKEGVLIFDGAVSNADIVLRNIHCGAIQRPNSGCVSFASISGGTLTVDGLACAIVGAVEPGDYKLVNFSGAVTGTDVSIVGSRLTLSGVTCTGNVWLSLVHAANSVTIAGRNAAGSTFRASGNRVSGSVTCSDGYAFLYGVFAMALTGFEHVECSNNDFSWVTLRVTGGPSSPNVILVMFNVRQALSLFGGGGNSRITMRNNTVKGASLSSASSYVQLSLWQGPDGGIQVLDGVAFVDVDGFDARNVTLTSTVLYVRALALYMYARMTMVGAASFSVRNVWISGQMSYRGTHVDGYGAKILQIREMTNTRIISVAHCSIDMSTGDGMVASNTDVHAIAAIMHFREAVTVATSITATNCSIRGKYSSWSGSGGLVQLCIFVADKSFSVPTLTIDGGSGVAISSSTIHQGPIYFTGAVTNTSIIIRDLACGDFITPDTACVRFASTIDRGSLSVNRITRTISDSVQHGDFNVIRFVGAVSNVDSISVQGMHVSLNNVAGAGTVNVFLVKFDAAVSGNGIVGSRFDVSGARISGSVDRSGIAALYVVFVRQLSSFEALEFSSNDLSGLTLRGTQATAAFLFYLSQAVTLIGTSASRIVMRGNVARGVTMTTSSGYVDFALWLSPNPSPTPVVTGVSTLLIDGFDARDCVLTATTYARFLVVFFQRSMPSNARSDMTMVAGAGEIRVNNVVLGGQVSYEEAEDVTYGPHIALLNDVQNLQTLTFTDCSIDMSGGSGLTASGASVDAIATILRFTTAVSIAAATNISNCAIRGKYGSSSGEVQLRILRADAAVSSLGASNALVLSDNGIDVTTADTTMGPVRAYIAEFGGSLAASGTQSFVATGNVVRGSLSSAASSVCAALAVGAAATTISGFEFITSDLHIDYTASGVSSAPQAGWSLNRTCGPRIATTTTTTTTTTTSTTTTTTFAPCALGQFRNPSASCRDCPPDTFSNTTGAIECFPCEGNATTNALSGQAACFVPTTTTVTTLPSTTTRPPRSRTKTQPPRRPTAPPPAVPAESAAVGVGMTVLVSPSAASAMRALRTAAAQIECGGAVVAATDEATGVVYIDPPPPLEFDSNMLLLEVGDSDFATYMGAVLSAIIINVVVFVLGLLFAAWRAWRQKLPFWPNACAKVKVPGHMAISLSVVAGPCMQAGVVLLAHPLVTSTMHRAVGAIGVLFTGIPFVLMLLLAVEFRRSQTLMSEEESDATTPIPDGAPAFVAGFIRHADWMTAPRREYEKSFTFQQWQFTVEGHVSVWWAASDYFINDLAISISGALSVFCASKMCCYVTGYATIALAVFHLVTVLAFKVYLVRLEAVQIPLMTVMTVVMGVMGVVLTHGGSAGALADVIDRLSFGLYVIAIISIVVAAYGNTLPTTMWVMSKLCASMASVQDALVAGKYDRGRRHQQQQRRGGADGAGAGGGSGVHADDVDADGDDHAPLLVVDRAPTVNRRQDNINNATSATTSRGLAAANRRRPSDIDDDEEEMRRAAPSRTRQEQQRGRRPSTPGSPTRPSQQRRDLAHRSRNNNNARSAGIDSDDNDDDDEDDLLGVRQRNNRNVPRSAAASLGAAESRRAHPRDAPAAASLSPASRRHQSPRDALSPKAPSSRQPQPQPPSVPPAADRPRRRPAPVLPPEYARMSAAMRAVFVPEDGVPTSEDDSDDERYNRQRREQARRDKELRRGEQHREAAARQRRDELQQRALREVVFADDEGMSASNKSAEEIRRDLL